VDYSDGIWRGTEARNIPGCLIHRSLHDKSRPFLTLIGPDLEEQRFTYLELLTRSLAWTGVYRDHGLRVRFSSGGDPSELAGCVRRLYGALMGA